MIKSKLEIEDRLVITCGLWRRRINDIAGFEKSMRRLGVETSEIAIMMESTLHSSRSYFRILYPTPRSNGLNLLSRLKDVGLFYKIPS